MRILFENEIIDIIEYEDRCGINTTLQDIFAGDVLIIKLYR